MWHFIFIIGLLGFIIFFAMAILSIFKKNGRIKKNFMYTGVCFVALVVGAVNSPPNEQPQSISTAKETSTPAPETQTAKKETEEEKLKKEAIEANFLELLDNTDKYKNKKVYIDGKISMVLSNDKEGVFWLDATNSNGIFAVINSTPSTKVESLDFVKVYGLFDGIDQPTGRPKIIATIIEKDEKKSMEEKDRAKKEYEKVAKQATKEKATQKDKTSAENKPKSTQVTSDKPNISDEIKELAQYEIKKKKEVADAYIGVKDTKIILALTVRPGTSKEKAKELGDDFVRLLGGLAATMNSDLSSPTKNNLGELWNYYDVHIGVGTGPDNFIAEGYKVTTSPKISW